MFSCSFVKEYLCEIIFLMMPIPNFGQLTTYYLGIIDIRPYQSILKTKSD